MERNTVTLKRTELSTIPNGKLGEHGLQALSRIPGVQECHIENEAADSVEISYLWVGDEKFWTTQEHLAQFGLERVY